MFVFFNNKKNNPGFTLVELMVVIGIIAVLSAVVLGSLGGSRARSRDARRVSDIKNLQVALRLFREENGRYPSSADGDCSYTNSFLAGGCMEVLVTNNLISSLPSEPDSSKTYLYDNWCRDPQWGGDQHFRMWTTGESNHNGLAQNWWADKTIGQTTCEDPS